MMRDPEHDAKLLSAVAALLAVVTMVVAMTTGADVWGAALGLPDPVLTPGQSRPVTAHTLCTTSTKDVRNVTTQEKISVFHAYGLKGNDRVTCREGYEIDHLISLEIGGSNAESNLWP